MLEKLAEISTRFVQVQEKLSDPEVVADHKQFAKLSKEYKELEPVQKVFERYQNILSNMENNQTILKSDEDADFKEMAKMELDELNAEKAELDEEIKILLVPKDPQDEKNVMLEIRAGTGGDEASIFAGDLFRMYLKYCENQGWSTELINENVGTVGGFKEVVLSITGDNVYGRLKYESGVHRVQRVPKTESQGRVHTSAASVAVLPEADDVDVDINPTDLKVDTFRASGAGGQHVNKTESAVRITHIPTNTVVECQEGRSQLKNREIAMRVLRSRIYEKALMEHNATIADQRKSLVSTGDRSAKIRTYNFPQGRVTDHRIGLTLYNLDNIIAGDVDEIIEKLRMAEQAEKLKEGNL